MKRLKIIFYTFLSFAVLASCDKDFEELNTDPNNPVAVPAHLLLGYAQRSYTNTIYGMQRGADMGGGWLSIGRKFSTTMKCNTSLEEE